MINTLSFEEVLNLIKSSQEQPTIDWKTDFIIPDNDEKKGEFLKDLAAIANSCKSSDGFIIYGINKNKPDPLLGVSQSYDDAKLQQLVRGKIDPLPEFLYYTVSDNLKTLGVLQIKCTHQRPYIIKTNLGKVRDGQILIRDGSSTRGATNQDLFKIFYDQTSGHFPKVLQQLQAHTNQQMADVLYMRELRAGQEAALRDIEMITGVKLR